MTIIDKDLPGNIGLTLENDDVKIHTLADFNIVLTSFNLGVPTPKTSYVDVVGGNGTIDLTDVYGDVFYNDRIHDFNFFSIKTDFVGFAETMKNIIAFLSGKVFKITLDIDPEWYYIGRMELNKYTTTLQIANIGLKATCKPYKYKQYETIVRKTITGNGVANCTNSLMKVCPTFLSDSDMTVSYDGIEYLLKANTQTQFDDIVFAEGINKVKIAGNGNVDIRYQEGAL